MRHQYKSTNSDAQEGAGCNGARQHRRCCSACCGGGAAPHPAHRGSTRPGESHGRTHQEQLHSGARRGCARAALLLLFYWFTTGLRLLPYCFAAAPFTSNCAAAREEGAVEALTRMAALLLLYCCFTAILLLLNNCAAAREEGLVEALTHIAALLLLYCCFTTA